MPKIVLNGIFKFKSKFKSFANQDFPPNAKERDCISTAPLVPTPFIFGVFKSHSSNK
jgi:hypothetical protein